MKNLVALTLACLLSLSLIGCTNTSNSSKTPSTNNSYVKPTQKTLSTSEKEDIAERETLKMLTKYMKEFFPSKFSKYDIDATRVNVSSIKEERDNYFCVYGKLYFYDKYGNLKDTATFDGTVDVDDDGSYHAYNPTINID